MHHNWRLKKRKQKPVKSANHFGHKFMSKIDINTIKSTPHTFRNTTISQLMNIILPKSPTAKIKCLTLVPQDRKRVLSHREQKRQVNMTRGDFHPWNWLANISFSALQACSPQVRVAASFSASWGYFGFELRELSFFFPQIWGCFVLLTRRLLR